MRRTPRGDLITTAPFRGAIAIVVLRDSATFGHQDRCEGPSSVASSQRRHRSHTTVPIWRLTAFLPLHVTAFVTFVNDAHCKFCVAVSRPSRQSLIQLRPSLPRGKMIIDAPTDGRDGTNPLDNARGESKRERVEETGGDCPSTILLGGRRRCQRRIKCGTHANYTTLSNNRPPARQEQPCPQQ